MLVMDCRLAILTNKLIKSQATISKFFLRGGNPLKLAWVATWLLGCNPSDLRSQQVATQVVA